MLILIPPFFQWLMRKKTKPPLVFRIFEIFVSIVIFLLTSVAFDMAQVFFDLIFILIFLQNFSGIDPNG